MKLHMILALMLVILVSTGLSMPKGRGGNGYNLSPRRGGSCGNRGYNSGGINDGEGGCSPDGEANGGIKAGTVLTRNGHVKENSRQTWQ